MHGEREKMENEVNEMIRLIYEDSENEDDVASIKHYILSTC